MNALATPRCRTCGVPISSACKWGVCPECLATLVAFVQRERAQGGAPMVVSHAMLVWLLANGPALRAMVRRDHPALPLASIALPATVAAPYHKY